MLLITLPHGASSIHNISVTPSHVINLGSCTPAG